MRVGVGVEGCFWTGESWFGCDFLKEKMGSGRDSRVING